MDVQGEFLLLLSGSDDSPAARHNIPSPPDNEKTLFKHVHQLLPGHYLVAENGRVACRRYWDVRFDIDWEHNAIYFKRRLRELLDESMALHLRADVPIGFEGPREHQWAE